MTLDAEVFYGLGVVLIFLGVLIILAAFVLLFISSFRGGKVRGGGAVIVGPFPIIFGTDKESVKTVLLLSIALTLLLLLVTVVFHFLYGG
ncbi:MAG: TIGR00304 family membrane protein [Candidatus Bathyarchaeales archaeon]